MYIGVCVYMITSINKNSSVGMEILRYLQEDLSETECVRGISIYKVDSEWCNTQDWCVGYEEIPNYVARLLVTDTEGKPYYNVDGYDIPLIEYDGEIDLWECNEDVGANGSAYSIQVSSVDPSIDSDMQEALEWVNSLETDMKQGNLEV